jgi:hypothetical protein
MAKYIVKVKVVCEYEIEAEGSMDAMDKIYMQIGDEVDPFAITGTEWSADKVVEEK